MSFAADIRKPCNFELNQNLISYICEDFEIELTDVEMRLIALEAERQIWSKLCRGDSVSIYEVINEIVSEYETMLPHGSTS